MFVHCNFDETVGEGEAAGEGYGGEDRGRGGLREERGFERSGSGSGMDGCIIVREHRWSWGVKCW